MNTTRILALTLLVLGAASVATVAQTQAPKHNLMRVPALMQFQLGRLAVTDSFALLSKGTPTLG